jgi:PAS domain-containing protein
MLHPLLTRQLRKIDLNKDTPPPLEQWQKFLERVNNVYTDNDQERYLIERSLMLSSKEMQEIHDQLRKSETRYALAAQGTKDGLWDWDLISDEAYYSQHWMEMMRVDKSGECVCSQQCWLRNFGFGCADWLFLMKRKRQSGLPVRCATSVCKSSLKSN